MNCPHCHRLLYSRQRRTCGYCGGELPPESRLTEGEISRLKAEQQAITLRLAAAKEQEDKEKERQRKESQSGGFYVNFSF